MEKGVSHVDCWMYLTTQPYVAICKTCLDFYAFRLLCVPFAIFFGGESLHTDRNIRTDWHPKHQIFIGKQYLF